MYVWLWSMDCRNRCGVGGSCWLGNLPKWQGHQYHRDMLRPGLPTLCMSWSMMLKSVVMTTQPWRSPMSSVWDFDFESPTFTAIRLESRNVCTNLCNHLYNRPVMDRACILFRSLACQTVSKALLMSKKMATVVRPPVRAFLTCLESLTTCSMHLENWNRRPAFL